MQPLVITLLIGTAFAMVNAAPAQNKLQSLQAILEGDDDLAKMAKTRWGNVLRRSIGVLNYVLNGMGKELAEQQEDVNAEAGRAGRALGILGSLFGDGDEEEPAVLEGDDDEAKAQFFGGLVRAVAPHVLGSILVNEMQLAKLQENSKAEVQDNNDDDDARKTLLDAIQAMMQDNDDMSTA